MGCSESSEVQQNNQSNKVASKGSYHHKAYSFKATSNLNTNIVITQNSDPVAVHVAIQQIQPNKPSKFAKGFFSKAQSSVEMPISVKAGNYKIHIIMNWDKQQKPFQIKLSDASVELKPVGSSDHHQLFYDCIGQQCKTKGKGVKQQKIYTCMYHQPSSNLIIIMVANQGQETQYNLDLSECKQRQKYQIINPLQSKKSTEWFRTKTIKGKSIQTWIIAPKVAYEANQLIKWEIKSAVLGDSKQCAMQIGAGFDRPSNPPPDSL